MQQNLNGAVNSAPSFASRNLYTLEEAQAKKQKKQKAAIAATVISAIVVAGFFLYKTLKGKKTDGIGKTIKTATKALNEGDNYQKTMAAAKRNRTHGEKKIIGKTLKGVRHKRLAVEHQATQEAISSHKSIKKAVGQARNLSQKANTVTTQEGAQTIKGAIKENQTARQAGIASMEQSYTTANAAKNTGKKIDGYTKKQTKYLKMAKNRDVQQRVLDAKTIEKASANATAGVEAAARREASQAAYLANTTAEERIAQEAKNAAAQLSSTRRQLNQKLSQPKYQRTLAEMQDERKWPITKLQQIINSNSEKVTPLEKEIAQYVTGLRNGNAGTNLTDFILNLRKSA